jgi:hypothetical protein
MRLPGRLQLTSDKIYYVNFGEYVSCSLLTDFHHLPHRPPIRFALGTDYRFDS